MANQQQAVIDDPSTISPSSVPQGTVPTPPAPVMRQGPVVMPPPAMGPTPQPAPSQSYQVQDPMMQGQPSQQRPQPIGSTPVPDAAPSYQAPVSNYTPQGFVPEAMQNISAREAWAPQIQQDLEENRYAGQADYRNQGLALRDQSLQLRQAEAAQRMKAEQDKATLAQKNTDAEQDYLTRGVQYKKLPDGSIQSIKDDKGNELYKPISENDAKKNGVQYDDDKGSVTGTPGRAFLTTRDTQGNVSPLDPDRNVKPEAWNDENGAPWLVKKNNFNAWEYIDPKQAIDDPKMQQPAAKALWTADTAKAESARDAAKDNLTASTQTIDPDKLGVNEKVFNAPAENQLMALQPTLKAAQATLDAGPPKPSAPMTVLGMNFGGNKIDQDAVDAYNNAKQQVSMLAPHVQNLQQYIAAKNAAKALKDGGPQGYLQDYLAKKKVSDDQDAVMAKAGLTPAQIAGVKQSQAMAGLTQDANNQFSTLFGAINAGKVTPLGGADSVTTAQSPPPAAPPNSLSDTVQSPPTPASSGQPSAAVSDQSQPPSPPKQVEGGSFQSNPAAQQPTGRLQDFVDRADKAIVGQGGQALASLGRINQDIKQVDPMQWAGRIADHLFGTNLSATMDANAQKGIAAGKSLEQASQNYVTDPTKDKTFLGHAGSFAGGVLPYTMMAPAAPLALASGGLAFKEQGREIAKDKGASDATAEAASYPVGAVGGTAQTLLGPIGGKLASRVVGNLGTSAFTRLVLNPLLKAPGAADSLRKGAYNFLLGSAQSGFRGATDLAAQNAAISSITNLAAKASGGDPTKQDNPMSAFDNYGENVLFTALMHAPEFATGQINNEKMRQAVKVNAAKSQAITKFADVYGAIDASPNMTPEQKATAKEQTLHFLSPDVRASVTAHINNIADAQAQIAKTVNDANASLPPANPKLARLSDSELQGELTGANPAPHPDDPNPKYGQANPQEVQAEIDRRAQANQIKQQLQPVLEGITNAAQRKTLQIEEASKTPQGIALLDGVNRHNATQSPDAPKADLDTAQLASDVSPKTEPNSNVQPHALGYLPVAHDVEKIQDPKDRHFAQTALKVLSGREIAPQDEKSLVGSDGKAASLTDLPAHLGASGMPLAHRDSQGNVILTDEGLNKLRDLVPSAKSMLVKDGMPVTSQHLAENQGKTDEKSRPKAEKKLVGDKKSSASDASRVPHLASVDDATLQKRLDNLQTNRERLAKVNETAEKSGLGVPDRQKDLLAKHDQMIAEHEQEIAARQKQRQAPAKEETSPSDRYWTATGDRGTEARVPAEKYGTRDEAAKALRSQLKPGELLHDTDVYPPENEQTQTTASEKTVESQPAAKQKSGEQGEKAAGTAESPEYDEYGRKKLDAPAIKEETDKLTGSLDNLNKGRELDGKSAIKVTKTDDKNVVLETRLGKDGKIEVLMNPDRVQIEAERFRRARDGGDPRQWLKDALSEELKHVADMLAAREKWEAAGSKGSANEFWQAERRKDLEGIKSSIEGGNKDVARAFVQAFHNYANTGHVISDRDFAAKTGDVSDENVIGTAKTLIDKLQNSEGTHDVEAVSEFIRQMLQAKNDGTLTESGYHAVVGRLLDWMRSVYETLQHVAHGSPEIAKILKPIEDLLKLAENPEGEKPFKPMSDEEIKAKEDAEKESKEALPKSLMQTAKEIARTKGILPDDYDATELKEGMNKGHLLGLIRKGGMSMDSFRQALNDRGFNFETPNDMVQALLHKPETLPEHQPGGLKAGHNSDEGEEVRPEDIERKMQEHLDKEKKVRDDARNENSTGSIRGRSENVERDREVYDSIAKNGSSSPERFSGRFEAKFTEQGSFDKADLLKQAVAGKALISPADFKKLAPFEIEGGHEHRVFALPSEGKVIKSTRPGKYGLERTLPSYLARMEKQNILTKGLDIKMVGFTPDTGTGFPSLVSEMALLEGVHPKTWKEVYDALTTRYGFKSVGGPGTHRYSHPETGLEIFDAHEGNILKVPHGDFTPEQRAAILKDPQDFKGKWDYMPIDIGIKGDPKKPIFGTDEEASLKAGSNPQTKTPEFKKWFWDSKVVDEDGEPKVMYHGTPNGNFDSFDTYGAKHGVFGSGSYFTENQDVARGYAYKGKKEPAKPSIYPVYLSIKNPMDMNARADLSKWENTDAWKEFGPVKGGDSLTNGDVYKALEKEASEISDEPHYEVEYTLQNSIEKQGHDGITHIGGGAHSRGDGTKHRVYIAFHPEQIKSAIGNNGDFDPNNPSIARAGANEIDPDDYDKLLSEVQQGMPAQADLDSLREQAMAEKPGEQTIGQPRKANPAHPGGERRGIDAIQHAREEALKNEKQSHEQWNQEAYKRLEEDPQKVKKDLLKKALDPQKYGSFDAVDVKSAQILVPQLMQEAYRTGDEAQKREAATLAWAYDQGGSDQARAFAARHDPFKTPVQRHLEYLTKMMTTPDRGALDEIKKAPASERNKLLEKAQNERLQKIEKALSEMGIKPEDIFAGEARVSLKSAKFVQDAIGKAEDAKTKQAMRMFLDKAPLDVVRQQTGLSKEEVQAARNKFDAQIRAKVADYVKNRGFKAADFEKIDPASLKAGAEPHTGVAMTPEEQEAEINKVMEMIRGDYKAVDSGKYVKSRKTGTKSSNPEQAAHDKQSPFDWKKFDSSNKEQVVRAARLMQAAVGNKWEMIHEYWQNSILSGPQTHVAISLGQGMNAMHEFVFKRPIEAALNAVFYKDPKSAQVGELKHLYSGIMPGLSRAWAQSVKTFRSENDFTKADMLNGQMEIKGDDFQGSGHLGVIPGKLGRVIRIPCRVIMALDSYNKNLAGMMAVGAEAYRSGKAQGLDKDELSAHIDNEIKTPGSDSWQKAYNIASNEVGFHAEVPELMQSVMKYRNLRDSQEGLVKKMSRMAVAMTFPFVKVPYNLTRIGLRKSPLGILNVGGHILDGAYSMAKGKPFVEGYSKAQQISDAAEQFLAWGAAGLLASAVEGDSDDDKKNLLITAPRYYGVNKPGDVAALDRKFGGPTMIRIGGRNGIYINYGKFEPLATVLGSLATGVRGFKDKKGANFVPDVMQGVVGQLKGNSFLQGMSTILDTLDAAIKGNTEDLGPKWIEQFAQGFVPNIFRQPIRNWDESIRDSKFAGPGYVMTQNPNFLNQAVDLYGKEQTKTGIAPLRVLFQSGVTPSPTMEMGDKFLTNYNQIADKPYWPDRPSTAQYSIEKNGKKIEMTQNQASAWDKMSGQMFKQKISTWLTPQVANNPTEEFKKRFTEDLEQARREAKQRIQTTALSH